MKYSPILIKAVGASTLLLAAYSAQAIDVGAAVNNTVKIADDTAITASLKTKIAADTRIKHSDISVTTTNGVAVLTGTAATAEAKAAAEEQAKSISGVTKVQNNIEVSAAKGPSLVSEVKTEAKTGAAATSEVVSDSWITTKVKTQLLADELTKGTAMTVKTKGKVVYLRGTARSEEEKEQAIKLASETNGVTKVNASKLRVVAHAKVEAN
jgi:hyperosmotically inducible protein